MASFQLINESDLNIDPSYQRPLYPKHKQYAKNWSDEACGVLSVSHRQSDGKFYVIDGQQRLAAFRIVKAGQSVPCFVTKCKDAEEEAILFKMENTDRKSVTQYEKFRALHKGGDEEAVWLVDIASMYGFWIRGMDAPKGNFLRIDCISKMQKIARNCEDDLIWVFLVLAASREDENKHHLVKTNFVGALGMIAKRHKSEVKVDRLVKVLKSKFLIIEQEAALIAGKSGGHNDRGHYEAILNYYNKGLRSNRIGDE